MALARSASGPGSLSINTSSANSLFGSNNTTPAAGGMFGSTQASKPLFGAAPTTTASSGGLFGTSQPASQPGGLFGSTATTSQPQTGGLFGAATPTTQPQTGGMFGSSIASQPQTGGLFGQPAATTQPATGGLFGSIQQAGGGLFGNNNTSQPAATGGLFGSSTAASQPQQIGGLFGQQNQNPTQNAGGSLFGGNTTQQNQSGGLFSGLNNQNQNKPATSLFSQPQQPSMFSSTQNQQQQQQVVPGVLVDMSNVKGLTRYNDLQEDLQKQLEMMENLVALQIRRKGDCEALMPNHGNQLNNIPTDVDYCNRKLRGTVELVEGDAIAVSGLQDLIKKDATHAKLSFRAIDNLKLPSQYHNSGHWPTQGGAGDNRSQGLGTSDAQDLVGYIAETCDELAGKLAKYQNNVTEIELHLRGVEASTIQQIQSLVARRNGGAAAQDDEIQELAESLQDFERGILNVAGKVGSTREGVQSLQLGGFMAPTSNGTACTSRSRIF